MITWADAIRVGCVLLFFGLLFAAALYDPSEPEPREQVDWLQPATDLDELDADVRQMLPDHTGGAK